MKIVFVGNFNVDYTSETHHTKSIEALGHQVIRLQEGVATGEQIENEASRSDLLIIVHTHGWSTPGRPIDVVMQNLKGRVKIITYHLDLWMGIQRQKDLETDPFYKLLDYFFCTDRLMAEWLNRNTGVKGVYIPAGIFHEEAYLHKDYSPNSFDNEIIFVGSRGYHKEWPYRAELIDWLKSTYGNRFKHYGNDGLGVVRGHELNRLYARSKIAIGDTLCIGFNYPYYFSDRLFESTGRGAFTIFPYILGIDGYFKNEQEIVTYKFGDFNDLHTKIDNYLFDDSSREAIRLKGHARAKNEYTYVKRWEEILSYI